MKISPTGLFSVVLLVASVGALGIPTVNVNVTNLPLDGQGNLRVSSSENTKILRVFKDVNVSFTGASSSYLSELTEVKGFSEMYMYVSVRNWTAIDSHYEIMIFANSYGIVDGIRARLPYEEGTTHFWVTENHPQPYGVSARYLVWAPTIQIEVSYYGYLPTGYTGSMLLSVSLYLKS